MVGHSVGMPVIISKRAENTCFILENRKYAAAPAAAALPKGQVVSVIGAVVDVQFEEVFINYHFLG